MDREKFMKDVFGDDWTGDIPDSTIVDRALKTLTPREEQTLKLRYSGMTYQQIGDLGQLTRERIRQILNKALKKLRHPSRLRFFKGYKKRRKKNIEKRFMICEEFKSSDISLGEYKFSVRVSNCFRDAGINTLGELASKTEAELLKIINFGPKSLNEVKRFLDEQQNDMRMSKFASCRACGNMAFTIIYQIRVLSALRSENPTGKKVLHPVQVWQCCQCNRVYTPDEIDVSESGTDLQG